ncbi:MAG: energy-coupling factor transporter transmembrane protein EcfT [Synergistaceae bacterium]|nr:energy-coupling factor transporter transmembrane protein EcfT [Synergistaceae bacterium]
MRFDSSHVCDRERPSRLDIFDPRCRVICALFLTVVLASVRSMPGLLASGIIPFLLLFAGDLKELLKTLAHVNAVTVFVWLLLPLTTPGPRVGGVFSVPGLHLSLLVTCKLNLISVTLIRMVVDLGMGRIDNVLGDFRLSGKMRVLLLLTMRYVFLLMERVATMIRAIRLRAPELRGRRLCAAFACMLGTTLIHSSDRAERSMLAMRCRGGMSGFSQCCPMKWRSCDTLLCAIFGANAALIVAICLY